ncbi:MAG TPA: DUF4870 domain-containing protein [Roseiflexaceae bacterium]|nr:DUF4870 domain-containing protein [Roseiflexaceae bacterium]
MAPDEDERVLGALAHASIVANAVNMAGMIAATLIWATQRERSRFVRAHALQALAYQGAVLLLTMLLVGLWVVCLALSLLPAVIRPDLYAEGGPPTAFWFALLALALPLGFVAAATVYGLYGAYQVYRGRPFRYPLVGRLVRRDLETLNAEGRTLTPESVTPPPIMPPAAPATPAAAPPAAAAREAAEGEKQDSAGEGTR